MKAVACIMLANGRPAMVRRAVASFHAQEYKAKQLVIWNTGDLNEFREHEADDVAVLGSTNRESIGAMRNSVIDIANGLFPGEVDVIAHWDSDDWSHPSRLVEQVQLLEATNADIVGYREAVFWDTTRAMIVVEPAVHVGDGIQATVQTVGEAWVYNCGNPAGPIGSSMLYPMATWQRTPFPNRHAGEDTLWLLKLSGSRIHATPSTFAAHGLPIGARMICAIHGQNTTSKLSPGKPVWKREPRWDAYCAERMRLRG